MVKKILIIDDDPGFVSTTRERLDFEGYEVVTAADGDEGLDAVEREHPDLVVLDILMPRLNGYAFLKMLHARHPAGKIAVIVCSGRDDTVDMVKSEGIAGFLVKPFAPQELVTMIKVTFQLREPEHRPQTSPPPAAAAHAPTCPSPLPPKPEPTAAASAALPPEVPAAQDEAPARAADPQERYRILIVDDEGDFADALKERLSFEGFEVATASDGQEGLELTRRDRPHLIILDVMMPKIDGYMVCRLLKYDEKYQNIPIIVLTARSLNEDRDIGLSSGADDYITKPLDFALLLKKIRQLLHLPTPPERKGPAREAG